MALPSQKYALRKASAPKLAYKSDLPLNGFFLLTADDFEFYIEGELRRNHRQAIDNYLLQDDVTGAKLQRQLDDMFANDVLLLSKIMQVIYYNTE